MTNGSCFLLLSGEKVLFEEFISLLSLYLHIYTTVLIYKDTMQMLVFSVIYSTINFRREKHHQSGCSLNRDQRGV